MEQVMLSAAVSALVSKLVNLAYDEIKRKGLLHGFLWDKKASIGVITEYMASVSESFNVPQDKEVEFLSDYINKLGFGIVPIDIGRLVDKTDLVDFIFGDLKIRFMDLVGSGDAFWLVGGYLERGSDFLTVAENYQLLLDSSSLDKEEALESEIANDIGLRDDNVYQINYVIIPVTKAAIKRIYELVIKLHASLNELGPSATVKLRIYGKKAVKAVENTVVYDMHDHFVVIVYNVLELERIVKTVL